MEIAVEQTMSSVKAEALTESTNGLAKEMNSVDAETQTEAR